MNDSHLTDMTLSRIAGSSLLRSPVRTIASGVALGGVFVGLFALAAAILIHGIMS